MNGFQHNYKFGQNDNIRIVMNLQKRSMTVEKGDGVLAEFAVEPSPTGDVYRPVVWLSYNGDKVVL
jgi:hypothetical protein